MVIVFELIHCRQSNSFGFHSPPGFGSVEKNSQHKTALKPEEKQEKDGKPETIPETIQPETEAEKEVVIPATVEKKAPTKTAEVSPYADVADSIAAARTVEFANAQALADVPNQTSALVQVKVSPYSTLYPLDIPRRYFHPKCIHGTTLGQCVLCGQHRRKHVKCCYLMYRYE